MNQVPQHQTIVVVSQKSPIVAAALGFFFGPLGLFYSNPIAALIGIVVSVPLAIFTLGLGLLAVAPICAITGFILAGKANQKLLQPSLSPRPIEAPKKAA